MKTRFLFLIALFSCFVLNAVSQNLTGKWITTQNVGGASGATTMQLNADGTGAMTTTTTEKTPVEQFTLTITTVQTISFTWEKVDDVLKTTTDPSRISIKASSKVTGGTAAARAEAQKEANYYAKNYQQQLVAELNKDFKGSDYKVLSVTANNLELMTENDDILTFKKVVTKKK